MCIIYDARQDGTQTIGVIYHQQYSYIVYSYHYCFILKQRLQQSGLVNKICRVPVVTAMVK